MDINSLHWIVEIYYENIFSDKSPVQSIVSQIVQQRSAQAANSTAFGNFLLKQIRILREQFSSKHFYDENQLNILKLNNLDIFYGSSILDKIDNLIQQIRNTPNSSLQLWDSFFMEYNNVKNKVIVLRDTISPYLESDEIINEGYAIIEIDFLGKTELVDFMKMKEQMSNWFLIIEGYSRIEDLDRENYKIVSIETNSPTKIRVLTLITATATIIGVTADLLDIEEKLMKDRNTIEYIKNNPLSESEIQIKFTEDAEQKLQKKIDEKINQIVEEKMKNKHPEGNQGDIKNALTKSIQLQHDFIVNGGEVNFYLGDNSEDNDKKLLEEYNNSKQKVKELRDSINKIKLIDEKSEND